MNCINEQFEKFYPQGTLSCLDLMFWIWTVHVSDIWSVHELVQSLFSWTLMNFETRTVHFQNIKCNEPKCLNGENQEQFMNNFVHEQFTNYS